MKVELKADRDIPREQVQAARQRVESLEQYMREPPPGALRVTLREVKGQAARPYVADADMRFDGRTLAAHAAGRTPVEAADELAERMRRQVRRVVGAEVAQRNEPAAIRAALESLESRRENRPQARLKPPEERRIVHRRTYSERPETTREAVEALLDNDEEFHLFRHSRTGEDVVVYRRDDGRIGLLHPHGSDLADEDGVVVPEPSRYSVPLKFDDARAEMDELNHRFLYFVDIDDERGKVLYLRHDGDYGLIEPD
jgi:ribosome-associated translation inhibitor RaiA